VMLHARTLGFLHPTTGTVHEYTSPSPHDFDEVMRSLDRMTQQLADRNT